MSQVPSSSTRKNHAWSTTRQQTRNQQGQLNHRQAGVQPNGQMLIEPVQRVDSFNTSISSHELFSTYSTESSFDFNHPTPVDSADEHTFHTPEIEDLLWQEDYSEGATFDMDMGVLTRQDDMNDQPRFTGLASHEHSLPSPQSMTISTPAGSGHAKKLSQTSVLLTSPMSTPHQLKRPIENVFGMSETHNQYSYLHTPVQSSPHVASPIIQISSHIRGDSPARAEFEQTSINRKRSASSLSHGEYFPDVNEPSSQTNMLMPPSNGMEMQWAERGDERLGLDPAHRDDQQHPSFEDMQQGHEQEKKLDEVQSWLQHTTLDESAARYARGAVRPDRLRSRSTGAETRAGHQPILKKNQTPGPGLLVDEDSEYHYSSDDESNFSLKHEDHPQTLPADMPPRRDSGIASDDVEPLEGDLYRAAPWQDTVPVNAPTSTVRWQPESSSAAIHKFQLKAREFDSLSRSATWGTGRRRLSDTDLDSMINEPLKTRHQSLITARMRERGISFAHDLKAKAKESYLKRSNSRGKQTQSHEHPELEKVQSPEPIDDRSSTDSQHNPFGTSFSRNKSSSISAGLRGATGSLAAVGAGNAGLNIETNHESKLGFISRTIRRVRSKSDVNNRSPKSPVGITSLVAHEGGMPLPSLSSPSHEEPLDIPSHLSSAVATPSARQQAQSPIKMPLSPQPANVMPNIEGFRVQIRELNSNLEPFLVERMAHDQVRRYKRLVKIKVEHIGTCTEGKCQSGQLCTEVGGQAEVLSTHAGGRDAANNSEQFKITAGLESDNDESAFDGIVTPAAFPDGIPLPPTKKLPARFECPLCFQIKEFHKPSDWTKHVHEDVQPFTCTFAECSDPKSFKRKADWVRHENEKHRHLEWWQCTLNGCTHRCYRKDNFVQHLVREHKREEPRLQKGRPGARGKGKGSIPPSLEEQDFWRLVDSCRHEAPNDARTEPCKFCGNVCASWKKLSVHVGKHMEQIAMPVLELANKRNVTKDTIISPVEPLLIRNLPSYANKQSHIPFSNDALSPFSATNPSYHSSSAEHSPVPLQSRPHQLGAPVLGLNYLPADPEQGSITSAPFAFGISAGNSGFTYVGYDNMQYGSYSRQHVIYPQPSQFSTADTMGHTAAIDAGLAPMRSTYDDGPQYYSKPEQQFANYPGADMIGQQHMQTPVTMHGMNGGVYAYAEQQVWQGQ